MCVCERCGCCGARVVAAREGGDGGERGWVDYFCAFGERGGGEGGSWVGRGVVDILVVVLWSGEVGVDGKAVKDGIGLASEGQARRVENCGVRRVGTDVVSDALLHFQTYSIRSLSCSSPLY